MTESRPHEIQVGGPYFDDLTVGQVFDSAPAVTLTSGLSAAHQAIVGDRLHLALDRHLATAVTRSTDAIAHPGLAWDIAIGQSTVATHHVRANLFYRGLQFHRFPHLGDTLHTRTVVVGLRENSSKPGRAPTGMAALRVTTTDHDGNTVLDFYRCAMLTLSSTADPNRTVHSSDLSRIGPADVPDYQVPEGWDLEQYRSRVPGKHFDEELIGSVFRSSGDVVTNAPELARLTLNIAATHHDERTSEAGRLVYGGHTIGLALAQVGRALPNLVTILGWTSCDHTAPVSEGDTLTSELQIVGADRLVDGWAVHLRSIVFSHNTIAVGTPVLDWRLTALMA